MRIPKSVSVFFSSFLGWVRVRIPEHFLYQSGHLALGQPVVLVFIEFLEHLLEVLGVVVLSSLVVQALNQFVNELLRLSFVKEPILVDVELLPKVIEVLAERNWL